jgi:hypothetical protein
MTAWLLQDYAETINGARRRWAKNFGQGRFTVDALARAWMLSREANMRFQAGSPGVKPLGRFEPAPDAVSLTAHPHIGDSRKAPVAPLLGRFVDELRKRYKAPMNAFTYRGHGGGKFHGRGYSLDLTIEGRDGRGFYPPDRAVTFLRAVHDAATAVGAQWRMIYNDFDVADTVNRALGRAHVVFVGKARKTGKTVSGLNWHGPEPLILHFHLDLAPLWGASPSKWRPH